MIGSQGVPPVLLGAVGMGSADAAAEIDGAALTWAEGLWVETGSVDPAVVPATR